MYFNTLVDEMLSHCFRSVWFPSVRQFLDSKSLLSHKLTRDGDDIHLGDKGVALFVRMFKLWVYEREVMERRESESKSTRHPRHLRAGSRKPP